MDGFEFDTHLTKDGEIVVIHDEKNRPHHQRHRFCQGLHLWEELKQFDASSVFAGQYGFNYIPTLRGYFELTKGAWT